MNTPTFETPTFDVGPGVGIQKIGLSESTEAKRSKNIFIIIILNVFSTFCNVKSLWKFIPIFSPSLGQMIEIHNFLYKVGEILIFVS